MKIDVLVVRSSSLDVMMMMMKAWLLLHRRGAHLQHDADACAPPPPRNLPANESSHISTNLWLFVNLIGRIVCFWDVKSAWSVHQPSWYQWRTEVRERHSYLETKASKPYFFYWHHSNGRCYVRSISMNMPLPARRPKCFKQKVWSSTVTLI